MEFSIYDKILIKEIAIISIICLIVCVVSILAIIYTSRKLDKIDVIICIAILIIVIVATIVFSCIHISTRISDIKNSNYVTYFGSFRVVSNGRSDILVYIENSSIKLESRGDFDEGQYIGKVVYSRKSKVVLDINGTKE